ncbi:hypothetical protein BLD49_11560 [Erwinia sp. OLMDSP33]|nr:hypothetical protein BK416_12835 [Erwinia sp. OLSSP12]PIJ85106.1 hypothetical protein BLD49_11560 [Erwinia sp. OLMDSP33]PIJ95205.1 hypothetical protein BL249_00695 [Erwinia sp. OLFS4]
MICMTLLTAGMSGFCYSKDSVDNSLVTTLNAINLSNVKKENDKKILNLLSKLDSYQSNNLNLTTSDNDLYTARSADSTNIAPADDDSQDVLQEKKKSVTESTESAKNDGFSVNAAGQSIDSRQPGNVNQPAQPEKETLLINNKVNNRKNNENDGAQKKDLQGQIDDLNDKIESMHDQIVMLINLQKLSYDNKSISDELEKNRVPQASAGTGSQSYLDVYAKRKGVKISPAGFAYKIIKAGSDKIDQGALFSLTLTEKNTGGKVLSQVKDIPLRYNEQLPVIIYKAIDFIGYGGSIQVVALANKSYPHGDYPKGTGPFTPLTYMINVDKLD